ncbi:hypothetical protein [Nocardia yamanashiensis]|nr:hypothetical protein [Nocardia yamanashiensis]
MPGLLRIARLLSHPRLLSQARLSARTRLAVPRLRAARLLWKALPTG